MTTQRNTFADKFAAWIGDTNDFLKRFRDLGLSVWDNAIGSLQVTVTDDLTLTAEDSGKVLNIATDAKTFTLPLISADNLGIKYRFRNIGADDAVALTLSPDALDGIHGTIANAAADSVASGVVGKDLVNTVGTANKGDWVEIEAVALTEWYISGGVGIWASEG